MSSHGAYHKGSPRTTHDLPLYETHNDFWGLPSNPFSIYHTWPAWQLPADPKAERVPKEARPVCTHAIAPVWRELGERIYKHFDSINLKWTSIDPVRFAEVGGKPGPLFLWVGVLPGAFSYPGTTGMAAALAARCKQILSEYKITNVEIAFRESTYTRSAGPQLLDHAPSVDPTADVRVPFTPALGLQIAPKTFPHIEGTGCLYLCEGGGSDRIFLLTARHVVLPSSEYTNELYHRKNDSMPRRDIILLGSRAFQKALQAIRDKIGDEGIMIDYYKAELAGLGEVVEGEDAETTTNRRTLKVELAKAEASKARVCEFQGHIFSSWSVESQRTGSTVRQRSGSTASQRTGNTVRQRTGSNVSQRPESTVSQRTIGHVFYAPPISVGTGDKLFTEDWAFVELHREKFDWNVFRGNVIHLGTFRPISLWTSRLTIISKNRTYALQIHEEDVPATRAKFKYPRDRLMQLRDFIKEDELRHPTMLDENGEACLIVVKNGAATGATLGRATGIESFVREYKGDAIHSTSMEIAVYAYSHEDGAFSAPGDSGSVVGDANCRIVGMLIGGAGKTDSTDVTYVSPYYFLDERTKKVFPSSYLYPIPD